RIGPARHHAQATAARTGDRGRDHRGGARLARRANSLYGDRGGVMKGRLSTVLGLAGLFVVTAAAAARAGDYFGNPARAAGQNDAEAVRRLVPDQDAKPNQTDEESRTAMHYSAINGNVEIIAILIKAGAKLDVTDPLGNTPLHLAADRGRSEAGEVLLAA